MLQPHSPVPPNPTGSKYLRSINPADGVGQSIRVDVYSVLAAFNVTCPARAHAVKKLLCAGLRGKGDSLQDLRETIDAVNRAIALEMDRLREKLVIVSAVPPEQRQAIVASIREYHEGTPGVRVTDPIKFGDTPTEPGGEAAARSVEIWVNQTPRPPAPPRQPLDSMGVSVH